MKPGWAITWAAAWIAVIALALYLTIKEYKPMTDRLSRAVRTFVQALLGSGVPLVVAKLAEVRGVSDLPGLPSVLAPVIVAALSAAASAAWFTLFPPTPPTG